MCHRMTSIKMFLPPLMHLTNTLESVHKVLSLIYLLSFLVLKIKIKKHISIKQNLLTNLNLNQNKVAIKLKLYFNRKALDVPPHD